MSEKKIAKLIPYEVQYICNKCKEGSMQPTGMEFATSPPMIEHECSKCGRKNSFSKKYPKISYEREEIKELENKKGIKIACDCGNEEIFNTIDEETGKETRYIENEGQYATIDKFRFWEAHDTVGIVCEKCKKSIWMFT